MGGMLVPDYSHCATATEQCKLQLYYLEITYVKAYVELTRLVSEYEKLVNSTECKDTVYDECEEVGKELYIKLDKMTEEITLYRTEIVNMKGKIKLESKAEASLRAHIQQLTIKCKDMEATQSSLDKVRDVIHVLGACPGLGRPEFHIPKWVGKWVIEEFDPRVQSDEEIDKIMNDACNYGGTYEGYSVKAAETSMIEQMTIEGMPLTNPIKEPVWGTCPNCAGEDDETDGEFAHVSGHFRTCWDEGAKFGTAEKRTTCSHGKKAFFCIADSGNMREVWGQIPDDGGGRDDKGNIRSS